MARRQSGSPSPHNRVGCDGRSTITKVTEHLAVQFDGLHPRATVEAEVEAAELELRGQVPPGSLDELIHRLVEHRLRERARAGGR